MKSRDSAIKKLKILFLFSGVLLALRVLLWRVAWALEWSYDIYSSYSTFFNGLFFGIFISLAFALSLSLKRMKFFKYSIFSVFVYFLSLVILFIVGIIPYIDFFDIIQITGFLFFALAFTSLLLPRFNIKLEKKRSYLIFSFYYATTILTIYFVSPSLVDYIFHYDSDLKWTLLQFGSRLFFVPLISYFLYDRISFFFEEISEKEPTIPEAKPARKKPEEPREMPGSSEKVSLTLQRLLQEKEEWRKKLEELKSQKNELIKKGVITEEYYSKRYEEIMDQLVSIEDKIIQEKIRGGKKK